MDGFQGHGAPNFTWPKIVHIIRHGQAEHNVHDAALEKRNTKLTPLGQSQAASLSERVRALNPEVVLTSPILRAVQTTAGFIGGADSVPIANVVVVPDARERVSHSTHLCELPLSPAAATADQDRLPADPTHERLTIGQGGAKEKEVKYAYRY